MDRRGFIHMGAAGLAAFLASCDSYGPKSAKPLLRLAERGNEKLERDLFRHTSMDHTGGRRLIGRGMPSYYVSDTVPVWDTAARGTWTLEVSGLVRRPLKLTLDQLSQLRSVVQRQDHFCVEGWTATSEWQGVRVSELARLAGLAPEARYVDFQSFDSDYHESWDLESALHPKTMIAYAREGRFLDAAFGAPARLHSPVKLGYKNVKYLTRVAFLPERNGGYWSDQGYEWYAGT
ncbi:MAG TPA: molybdopterin-dependent oxidoreductase [Longimicrobiales bacterium]